MRLEPVIEITGTDEMLVGFAVFNRGNGVLVIESRWRIGTPSAWAPEVTREETFDGADALAARLAELAVDLDWRLIG